MKKLFCFIGIHTMHEGLSENVMIDSEPGLEMFIVPGDKYFNGFWTTGKCIHCGKQMLTQEDIIKKQK